MNYKTHLIGGACFGVLTSNYLVNLVGFEMPTMFGIGAFATLTIASSIAGAIFPDIDKRNSYIGNRTKILSAPLEFLLGHRGLFHSPIFNILLVVGLFYFVNGVGSGLSYFISKSAFLKPLLDHLVNDGLPVIIQGVVIGFGVGTFSHLFLDAFNGKGIPLLLPFRRKRYRIMSLNMGGLSELLLQAFLILITAYFSITSIISNAVSQYL